MAQEVHRRRKAVPWPKNPVVFPDNVNRTFNKLHSRSLPKLRIAVKPWARDWMTNPSSLTTSNRFQTYPNCSKKINESHLRFQTHGVGRFGVWPSVQHSDDATSRQPDGWDHSKVQEPRGSVPERGQGVLWPSRLFQKLRNFSERGQGYDSGSLNGVKREILPDRLCDFAPIVH